MKYAFAKFALVAAVFTAFESDASAQGRGRRASGFYWTNPTWVNPSVNTGWYYPSTYSRWDDPVTYGSYWNGRGRNRTYYQPYYYTTPNTGTVVTSDPVITQTSYYEPSDARKSLLTVIVPASDAQLWLNGTQMNSQGIERNFSSPPLDFGVNYKYTVKAQWTMDGKPVEQVRDVTVRAGQRSTVDFRSQSGQPAPAPVPQQLK